MAKRNFVECDIDSIISERRSKSSKYQENTSVNYFNSFLANKSLDIDLETMVMLNGNVERF